MTTREQIEAPAGTEGVNSVPLAHRLQIAADGMEKIDFSKLSIRRGYERLLREAAAALARPASPEVQAMTSEDVTKLQACPFCGMDVELKHRHGDALIVIACPEASPCHGSGLGIYCLAEDKASGIAAWNRRSDAALTTLSATIEELRAERDSLDYECQQSMKTIADERARAEAAELKLTRMGGECAIALARARAAESQLTELREALEPFAAYATAVEGSYTMELPDSLVPGPGAFPMSDYRRARAAIRSRTTGDVDG